MKNNMNGLGWALDNANVSVKVKPKRPYTPYNIFYLLERELLVQDPSKTPSAARPSHNSSRVNPEDCIEVPARYKGIVMAPQWYDSNFKEKRKHRRTHGKISFHKLTELISKNWATIDEESKSYCTKLSEMSRKRYKENMNKFNASRKILELKQEKSIMLAATEKSQMKQVGTPPRAKATRPLLRTTIHAVTPDRSYSSKSSDEHPPKQPVVTPSYNPHANRRPVSYPPPAPYYGYGTSPPPPLPPSPPPMPTQVLPQYHPTYARIPSPLPSTMPSPMASRSSPNYHGYGQYYYPYKPHKNYYPPYKNAHYSNTHETRRSVYNYYNQESLSSSYAPPPDHHWNYPAHLVSAIYKPYKHICNSHDGKYDYDCYAASSQRQDSTCKRGNHSSPEAPQNYSKTQGDSTNIHSMMSFDSPKSNQIEFDLSFENLKACQSKEQKLEGNEASNHGAYANGSQEEDEESIMGWLREGLLPVDTGGIPF